LTPLRYYHRKTEQFRLPDMPQPPHISRLPVPDPDSLDEDLRHYFDVCQQRLGLVPNVLLALSYRPARLRNFISAYNEIMLGKDSGLSRLEREMIAVVVSSHNRCYYCLVAHGQAVRELSGDPELGELLVMNYRVAELPARQRIMLDFAWKLTASPDTVGEVDRVRLRAAGFDDRDIFDIAEVTGLFNYSNRMAMALDMMPNPDYHAMHRIPAAKREIAAANDRSPRSGRKPATGGLRKRKSRRRRSGSKTDS
jgi:uncharacterized peroxidase-related enzyme